MGRNSYNPTVVFVDLDSTLCDTRHRQAMLDHSNMAGNDWVAYSLACTNDVLMEGTKRVIDLLADEHRIVIVSGRAEEARTLTEQWLSDNGVLYDELLLNENAKDPNYTHGAYKLSKVSEYCSRNRAVPVLVIDDWPEVADAFKDYCPVMVVLPPHLIPEVSVHL